MPIDIAAPITPFAQKINKQAMVCEVNIISIGVVIFTDIAPIANAINECEFACI